ncbi:hypothetical protein BCIN_03g01100 [Botrytis cinerea B05.10]|uniref:Zn(2)-C6 fungal-type domain-containing protein n=2 Tax=Botryotinia fuckeliana TaxID=40559 RepID=A0A384JB85_BOTFB|nr:hypothetical protein BCIN_03g01100 [Botrytis cinerea B05.10]ATZ47813.1 hypothetical protein BCIN_03g01100 [Botrytis cinerea B05.10]EMR89736.1 putative fungal transcriptional regulatory protein [Botrytis cinerea BcDW1]
MTLPVACPPSSASSDPPTVAQRKRRRRAPASGASDDCFTCTKRNVKCDRRRPYCSQCLEVGNECSGYKTQLTWGVGVASRGKLRGLSLPVAKSPPAPKSPPITRPRAASTIARTLEKNEEGVRIKLENAGSVPVSPFMTYDFVNMAPHGNAATATPMSDWNITPSHEFTIPKYHPDTQQRHMQRSLPPQLHRIHTLSIGRPEGLSSSVDSLSPYPDSEYTSPISQSFQNEEVPFLNSPAPLYNSYSSRNTSVTDQSSDIMGNSRGPTSCPDQFYAPSEMSSSMSSHQNMYDLSEGRQPQRSHQASSSVHEIFYDDEMLGMQNSHESEVFATSARSSHFGWTSINEDDVGSPTSETDTYGHITGHDSMSSSLTSEMSPRISFFLDYYEKIICPSVVVIDSPSNPYREHILALASSSQSLQHAICALAACNLRMKRKQSLGQDHWRQPIELELQDRINAGSIGRPVCTRRTSTQSTLTDSLSTDASLQEEYQHRSLAVSLLNQQLTDPSKARHDCVLATLFILCHYRMCESGIAQFRTQFAGVKKILGMRECGTETGNWGWMESLFTYFDGIAASINDREAQLRGGYLEMLASPSNPNHGLENMAGCDAVLFKTIAKLGRLNLLSQHRPVMNDALTHPPHPNHMHHTGGLHRPRLAGQALVDFYNLHSLSFDGNGFASTMSLDDEPAFPIQSLTPLSPTSCSPTSSVPSYMPGDDPQTTFWTEWKAARLALQEWEFSPSHIVSSLPVTPSPTQLRDFGYISEAFRYSALLYTERLACPKTPSSHLNFQNLVSQVLFYVTSLETNSGCEKFLLWPLFISGSECVNELQQSIVRSKCREIMGRSGYLNNLAGLEVLEKLWAEGKDGRASPDAMRSQSGPFKWSKHMEGIEGEWIMV